MIRLILMLCLYAIVISGYSQKQTVRITAFNSTNNLLIRDNNIKLIIINKNYGIGTNHRFVDGICSFDYPVDQQVRFTIVSDQYFLPGDNVRTVNVINESSDSHIYLTPISEQSIVIKGSVTDSVLSYKALENSIVRVVIDSDTSFKTVSTDEYGFFKIVYDRMNDRIGSSFTLTVSKEGYHTYTIRDRIARSRINDFGNIGLTSIKKPAKTGLLKFKGPPKLLEQLVVTSPDCEVYEVKTATGLFQITPNNEGLTHIRLRVHCSSCKSVEVPVALSSVLDKGNVPEITLPIYFKKRAVLIAASAGYRFLLSNSSTKKGDILISADVSTIFKAFDRYFEGSVSVSLITNGHNIKSNYNTLPGKTGSSSDEFLLHNIPEIGLNYYFSNLFENRHSFFIGVTATHYLQIFKQGDLGREIVKETSKFSVLAPGLRFGLHYNLSNTIALKLCTGIEYVKLRKKEYQFNYFGSADESIVEAPTVTNLSKLFIVVKI